MGRFERDPLSFTTEPSPFGPFALIWEECEGRPRIRRILLSKPGLLAQRAVQDAFPGITLSTCTEIDRLARQIHDFLQGEDIRFGLENIRLDLCSLFQQDVLRAEHGIPRGSISTYQRIARHVGRPSGARAVGMALAQNPFPIIIPCHRAIRANGRLGGYQGGLAMKRKLLEMEGVTFDDSGYVTTKVYFY